jgi:hypothetical protein
VATRSAVLSVINLHTSTCSPAKKQLLHIKTESRGELRKEPRSKLSIHINTGSGKKKKV